MLILKKLLFTLPFLLSLTFFYRFAAQLTRNPYSILEFNQNILIDLIIFTVLLLASSLFFILFATLANNWKFLLPVSLPAALISYFFFPAHLTILLISSLVFSFGVVFWELNRQLSSYLDFKPASLLIPSINRLVFFLLLIISFVFYLNVQENIQQKGFQLPDSLIETSLKITMPGESIQATTTLPQVSPDQIAMLKANPELLKQYGLDSSILDQLDTTESIIRPESIVKTAIQQQFQSMIEPYKNWIPLVLTITFFLSIRWAASLLSVFLSPLIRFIFIVLEKTGCISYQLETRVIKKMLV